jgi:hypothetical protein
MILESLLRVLRWLNQPRVAQWLLKVFANAGNDPAVLRNYMSVSAALNDTDSAIDACDRLLRMRPDDSQLLWNLAVFSMRQGNLKKAESAFSRHIELTTGKKPHLRAVHNSYMDSRQARTGKAYVARLEDVLVDTGYWSILQDDRVYIREVHDRTVANSPLVRSRMTPDGSGFLYELPEQIQDIKQPCIFLGGDDNYCHWLTRNLIKLCLLDNMPEAQNMPFLINDDLRQYQQEYLSLLAIPEKRLQKVARNTMIHCQELLVPTQLRNHPDMIRGINWLRNKVSGLMVDEDEANEYLYLSRRDTELRNLVNDDDLEQALSSLGFNVVLPGSLSVAEQIRAFSGAKVIVAQHGAGMANILYAPRNARIIEITSTNIYHMDDFRIIAGKLGQKIETLVSSDYISNSRYPDGHRNREFSINIDDVMVVLQDSCPELFH